MSISCEPLCFRTKSSEGKLTCEDCSTLSIDIFVCKVCFSFCCSSCQPVHICSNEPQSQQINVKFQKIECKVGRGIQLRKKKSEESKNRSIEGNDKKKDMNRCCQRCFTQSASKKCLACKINIFCQQCFKNIHNSIKLSHHQFTLIKQIDDKSSRLQAKSVKGLMKKQSINSGCEASWQIKNQKARQLQQFRKSIDLLKNNLKLDELNHKNAQNEILNTLSKHFQCLIEQINCKLLQLTLQIRQNSQKNNIVFEKSSNSLNFVYKSIDNLKLIQQQSSDTISSEIFDKKYQKCLTIIKDSVYSQQIPTYKEQYNKLCEDISQEFQEMKRKIMKIDIKKNSFVQQNSKISSNSNSSLVNEKQHQSNKNEAKQLKTFLSNSSLKSIQKSPITLTLTSPRKNDAKVNKQLLNISSKSLFSEPDNFLSPQEQKQKGVASKKYLTIKTNITHNNNQYKKIDKSKDREFLLSPKATLKKVTKDAQNFSKCNFFKAGANIEKTKKMIKQIRHEISEFTTKYNTQKQLSESMKYQKYSQMGEVTQLSIQSLTDRSKA